MTAQAALTRATPTPTPIKTSVATRSRRERGAWLFLLPAAVPYLLVVILPSMAGIAASFTDWNGLDPAVSFVGFDNFARLMRDETSLRAIRNTFVYAGLSMVVENILGLAIALALHSKLQSRNVLRVIFFTPVVLLSIVVGYLWQFLFQTNNGAVTQLVHLGFPSLNPNWLGDPSTVVFAITFIVIWQFTGYTMVIYLAGLQGISQDQMEAAALDGAGSFARFWHVVLPMLAPAVTANVMLSLVR